MSKYINSLMQISAASVVLMSAAFADQNQTCCKPCPPCIPPCIPIDLCYSYPLLQNGYNVHMDVGYILEQFVLTGTDFAYVSEGPSIDSLPQSVKLLRPKFNVASGVTAELGFYFEHDHWFVNSRFDWVSRKGKKSFTAEDTDFVVPMGIWTDGMLAGTDATSFSEVHESLRVSYYDLQIDLNRGTFFTHYLAVEPHAGLKAAWIYYKGEQEYTGGSVSGTLEHEQKTSFWGVGPDFGLNSDWRFGGGFGMYWDSTVAILCGGANVKDYANFNESATYNTYAKLNRIVMSPTARTMFGFQYNSGMFDSSQNIRIRLGCDAAYYWNQFQHIDVVNTTEPAIYNDVDNGGFGMIGMMIELGWDF